MYRHSSRIIVVFIVSQFAWCLLVLSTFPNSQNGIVFGFVSNFRHHSIVVAVFVYSSAGVY